MGIIDKLRRIGGSNDYDAPSKALALEWERMVKEGIDMRSLVKDERFKPVLGALKNDFKTRMITLIGDDPELTAIKRMFVRTVGMTHANEVIEGLLDGHLDEKIELSK